MKKIIFGDKKNIISEKLRELRTEKGISQSQLAAKLQTINVNIDQQMISKIERNDRIVTDYELVCICVALGVGVDELIGNVIIEMIED